MTAKIRFFLSIFISLLFLYLAIRNVDFGVVAQSFKNISVKYLFFGLASQFASLFCRAYLWKDILSFEKKVQYRHSFEALMIGYMGNNILPFRMGEAMSAYALGKKEGISRTLAFASIILVRLIDLFTLLLFFLALVFMMQLKEWVILSGMTVSLFLVLAVLFLYVLASGFLQLPTRLYNALLPFIPERFTGTVERIAASFVKGIKLIRNFRQSLWLLLSSLLAWILWTSILYFGLKAFHLDLPWTASLLLSVVVNIGVMIPSSPGFIGVFQYLCIISLAFFDVPKEIALSFSFLVHTIQYVPTTALGWLYLTQMHLTGVQALKEIEEVDLL
jgi:glycosyltransferase 2 family protein